jgi:hypothetical protein
LGIAFATLSSEPKPRAGEEVEVAAIDNAEGMAQLLGERTGEQLAECATCHGQVDAMSFVAQK